MSAFADSVLEPGERVLYVVQFHKNYTLLVALLWALPFPLLAGSGTYLYKMLPNNGQIAVIFVFIILAPVLCYLSIMISEFAEEILNYFSLPKECIVTDKRIIIKDFIRVHLSRYCSCKRFSYVYIPLPSSMIEVEQCRFAQRFDAGNVIVHGDVYRTGWFGTSEVKEVEKKHENYVWEREDFTSSYSCKHIRSPFALKQFLESQAPRA